MVANGTGNGNEEFSFKNVAAAGNGLVRIHSSPPVKAQTINELHV
uniref:Uncharacterized protein n=1 Tax=Nelumbo nucifera TaxID=4432 RepID=A0A822Y1X1_NELNU|nr:TPA_asm: hypothetical protein HUJ06_029362 [Nelumbo nucifera]